MEKNEINEINKINKINKKPYLGRLVQLSQDIGWELKLGIATASRRVSISDSPGERLQGNQERMQEMEIVRIEEILGKDGNVRYFVEVSGRMGVSYDWHKLLEFGRATDKGENLEDLNENQLPQLGQSVYVEHVVKHAEYLGHHSKLERKVSEGMTINRIIKNIRSNKPDNLEVYVGFSGTEEIAHWGFVAQNQEAWKQEYEKSK